MDIRAGRTSVPMPDIGLLQGARRAQPHRSDPRRRTRSAAPTLAPRRPKLRAAFWRPRRRRSAVDRPADSADRRAAPPRRARVRRRRRAGCDCRPTARAAADSRSDLLWLGLALFIIIGTGIGIRDPWPADEPRFAAVARDMVATGEWLFPRVGGDLYQDKPPMFFWMLAVCYSLIGSLKMVVSDSVVPRRRRRDVPRLRPRPPCS